MVQGALGYLQYFLHDAAWVVEFHLAGVTTLWIAESVSFSRYIATRPGNRTCERDPCIAGRRGDGNMTPS